jgi:hypothetical protein
MTRTTALGLFSGGLDSILACRVVADQGVRVVALKFVTPFFDHDLLAREAEYAAGVRHQYGLDVRLVDVSEGYLRLLDAPAHGFGRHFNPCIDCKILMLRRARELMPEYEASFLISGEVLGQRPMSQRRDTLRVIERDSGCEDILLRPLSARLMPPTLPERAGLVDRELLFAFSGRGRRPQKKLAADLGIIDYPNPAGGCLLTDPNLATRFRSFFHGRFSFALQDRAVDDVHLLAVGRQFNLGADLWFIVGRDERENELLASLRGPGDWLVRMSDRPGPLGLLRHGQKVMVSRSDEAAIVRQLAGVVIRYGRKIDSDTPAAEVLIDRDGEMIRGLFAALDDDTLAPWRM